MKDHTTQLNGSIPGLCQSLPQPLKYMYKYDKRVQQSMLFLDVYSVIQHLLPAISICQSMYIVYIYSGLYSPGEGTPDRHAGLRPQLSLHREPGQEQRVVQYGGRHSPDRKLLPGAAATEGLRQREGERGQGRV